MNKLSRVLSIDLGNYNTKTSKKVIFESRFKETEDVANGSEELIEFDGKRYFLEQGAWDLDFDKINKNYYPCLFQAIVKSYPNYNKITELGIVLGLPLSQLKKKDAFKEALEGKIFKFKYKGIEKEINISKVGIIGEGFSSIYTLSESERNDAILLVDIGGGTINIVDYDEMKVQETTTLRYGMYNFYEDIWNEALSGTRIKIERVRKLVEDNKIDESIVNKAKSDFVTRLKNDLKIFDPQFKTIYFTGGGSMTLKNELIVTYPDCKFTTDLLFSNVLGNKILADTLWGADD